MANNFLIKLESNQLSTGTRLKFDNGPWRDGVGSLLQPERQYVVVDVLTKLVRWHGAGEPPDVIAGAELPEVADLNAAVPQEDWSLDLTGKPRPPWAKWFITVLLDGINAQLFSHGNSTVGTAIAVDELRQRIALMSALQGAEVLAVVELRDAPMKTQFGDRRRPHFNIVGWRQFRQGQLRLASRSTNAFLEEVKPVSASTALKDTIPF